MKARLLSLLLFAVLAAAGRDEVVELRWSICEKDPQTVIDKLSDTDVLWQTYKYRPHSIRNVTFYYPPKRLHPWSQAILWQRDDPHGPNYAEAKVRIGPLPVRANEIRPQEWWPLDELEFLKSKDKPMCNWEWFNTHRYAYYACTVMYAREWRPVLWSEAQMNFTERWHGPLDWDNLITAGPFIQGWWSVTVNGHRGKLTDVYDGNEHHMIYKIDTTKTHCSQIYREVTEGLAGRNGTWQLKMCTREDHLRKNNWRSWPKPENIEHIMELEAAERDERIPTANDTSFYPSPGYESILPEDYDLIPHNPFENKSVALEDDKTSTVPDSSSTTDPASISSSAVVVEPSSLPK
jgi:hypothetical protein